MKNKINAGKQNAEMFKKKFLKLNHLKLKT